MAKKVQPPKLTPRQKKYMSADKQVRKIVETAATANQKIATETRKYVEAKIRDNYSTKPPLFLIDTISSYVSNQIDMIGANTKKAYKLVKQVVNEFYKKSELKAPITQKEIKYLAQRLKFATDSISESSVSFRNDLKKMLLGNISGRISFQQMVTGLKNLYPEFEGHIYTITNTNLLNMYKDTVWSKENSYFDYFIYAPNVILPNSHEYCKARYNRVYTAAEAAIVQAEMAKLYNCQHSLLGITKEQYEAGTPGPV